MSPIQIENNVVPGKPFFHLLELIPYWEENAISMKLLANKLCISDKCLRQHIQNARIAGKIIARSQHGYFIPKTYEELSQYYYYSVSRIRTNSATLKAVRDFMKEYMKE